MEKRGPVVGVGVGVFVWKGGKFLMGKRRGSHGHDTWSLPGGKLEFGETWEACAIREVREEAGLKIKNVRFLAATEDFFPEDNKHFTTIWVESDWASGKPTLTEPHKWVEHEWRTFQTLPTPLFEPCWQNLRKVRPDLFAAGPPRRKVARPDIHRLITFQQALLQFHAIERHTRHPDNFNRYETDTEHSYVLAMAGWFLTQYLPNLDENTVIRLALVHDLVELHAGDTFAYATGDVLAGKAAREAAAVEKLAKDWRDFPELISTIREYEARQTDEAKFVYALDKLMPILLNYLSQGRMWQYEGVTFEQFLAEKEAKIPISPEVEQYYRELLVILRDNLHFFAPSR